MSSAGILEKTQHLTFRLDEEIFALDNMETGGNLER